jgi:hypothetical protein
MAHEIPEIFALWLSPSGKGLKGLLRIPDDFIHNDGDFKKAYAQLDAYLSAYDVQIDRACKDVRRMCFVGSDKNIYINENAPAFMFNLAQWNAKPAKKATPTPANNNNAVNGGRMYIDRCVNVIMTATSGGFHHARLRAGKLAGGFIAAGLINETEIMRALSQASDSISSQYGDSAEVIQREQKTIYDAIQYGKGQPCEVKQHGNGQTTAIVYDFVPPPPPPTPPEPEPEEDDSDNVQAWNSDLTSGIDYIIKFDGVARDIQQWILDTSVIKQPAIALAATLSVLGVVVGRQIDYRGIKGNLMSICIAGSGHGKDHPLKCVDRLLDSVGLGGRIYSRLASGTALFETVNRHPSCVLTIDEMGHYLGSISEKGSNQFSKEIMPMITEMYTSANDTYRDKARKGGSKEVIYSPNLNLLGMTTERQIIDAMKSNSLADGSLARFLILFGEKPKQLNQEFIDKSVPVALKNKLSDLARKYGITGAKAKLPPADGSSTEKGFKSNPVIVSDDYIDACKKIGNDFFEKANQIEDDSESENAMFAPSYRRALVMAVQLSLVIDQCSSVESLNWAAKLVEQSINVFSLKFKHLSADNETERLVKIVERAIKEAGTDGISKRDFYNKTRQVPTIIKTGIIADLIAADKIRVKPKSTSQKPSEYYYWLKQL